MQPPKHPIRNLSVIIILIFVVLGSVYMYNTIRYGKMGQLTTNLAPSDSTLSLNGKRVKGNRMIYLSPGDYTWQLSRSDFTAKKGTFSIKKGDKKSLDLYLQASTAAGQKWLEQHPQESYRIEGAVGRRYDELSAQALAETPIIGSLPQLGAGGTYNISYDSGTVNGKPKTTIYISYVDDRAKQDALDWLTGEGTDPKKLTIEYTKIAPRPNTASGQWGN